MEPYFNGSNKQAMWSFYVVALCSFHFLEFFSTALFQPANLSYDCKRINKYVQILILSFYAAYVVNHSKQYTIAAFASFFEFWIEVILFGRYKLTMQWVTIIGIIAIIIGQVIRLIALFHSLVQLYIQKGYKNCSHVALWR